MSLKKYIRRKVPWWFWFVLIDSFLVVSSVLLVYFPKDDLISDVAYYVWANFSLGAEMTFAVWWSGLSILLVGLVCYENFSTSEGLSRFAWLVLSVLFTLLSLDEVGSIHERALSAGPSMLIFILAGVLFLLPAFFTIVYNKKTRKNGIILVVGSGLMASVALQEYIEHSINWSASEWALRMGIEEGSEIFGALICLVAVVNCRKGIDWPSQISRAIPNPYRMHRLPFIIVGALAIHALTSLYLFERISISGQGDPFIFFPYALFILISAYIYWTEESRIYFGPKGRFSYSLLFLISSLLSFYLLSPSFGLVGDDIRLKAYIFFVFTVFVLSLFKNSDKGIISSSKMIIFSLGIITLVFGFLVQKQVSYYVMCGVLSVLIYEMVRGAAAFRTVVQEQ